VLDTQNRQPIRVHSGAGRVGQYVCMYVSRVRTVLPASSLSTAFIALQQRIPATHAVAARGRPARRRHSHSVGVIAGGDGDVAKLHLGGALGSAMVVVERDGEDRAGAPRDWRDAQGLKGRDGPGFDVDGCRRGVRQLMVMERVGRRVTRRSLLRLLIFGLGMNAGDGHVVDLCEIGESWLGSASTWRQGC
jgi:hypothetical protein